MPLSFAQWIFVQGRLVQNAQLLQDPARATCGIQEPDHGGAFRSPEGSGQGQARRQGGH